MKNKAFIYLLRLFCIGAFSFLIWLIEGVDQWTAISLLYPQYLLVMGLFLPILLISFLVFKRKHLIVLNFLVIIYCIVLPFRENTALKPLIYGCYELKAGMTKVEVKSILLSQFEGTSWPKPSFKDQGYRLDIKPNRRDKGFAAESLLVFFDDNKYTHWNFSAD